MSVQFQGALEREQEHLVVSCCSCRAGDRARSADHVGILCRPLIGLARTHRPAGHQPQPFYSQVPGQQQVLEPDVVGDRHIGEAAAFERRRRIAGRRRNTIGEQVRQDDEVAARIESPRLAKHIGFGVVMRAGIPRRHQYGIVACRVQGSHRLIGKTRYRQEGALLQNEVRFFEYLVISHSILASAVRFAEFSVLKISVVRVPPCRSVCSAWADERHAPPLEMCIVPEGKPGMQSGSRRRASRE
jgi:hypothetical protein